ncbi:tRNA-intron endonuclease [Gracilaria domingensis]|nr:tRNA-intron endonuclease [Gracilaria domingensis]
MDPRPRKRRRPRTDDQPPPISALSIHSLRLELHRRNLPTTGLRSELESRLREACSTTPPNLSVPCSFNISAPFSTLHDAITANVPHPIPAILRHCSVWICSDSFVAAAWQRTSCGKANLSRSAPSYNALVHSQHANWKGRAMRQLIQLQASSNDVDRVNVEHLQLTFVEAFYAAFVTNDIVILDTHSKQPLTDRQRVWSLFCSRSEKFPLMFVAYCRYRSAGWLPKSALKYGANWVLYPTKSYTHTHAPYCVILQFSIPGEEPPIALSWIALQNRLRLVKNVAKNLIITRVHAEKEVDFASSISDTFAVVKVTELTIDRWLP